MFAIELNPASLQLSLESQLSKPWQRVMKYTLLLEAMLSRTTDNSERKIVANTIHQLRHTVEDLNKNKEDADLARLGKEREKFYGITIAGPARRYLFDSKIKVITHNTKRSESAILCTDALFIGKKKGLFSGAAFIEYDLRDVLIIKYPPLVSKFFLIRLSADQGISNFKFVIFVVIQIQLESTKLCDTWIEKFSTVFSSSEVMTYLFFSSLAIRDLFVVEVVFKVIALGAERSLFGKLTHRVKQLGL